MSIKFGTDGWRAVISDEFTFENVQWVSQAIADLVQEQDSGPEPLFIVGYDTRFLSDRYAKTVARVLAANGIKVLITEGFAATPAVSHAIVRNQAAGGVMITASHNPPRYNGLKLKAAYGGSASPEASRQVEARLRQNQQQNRPPQTISLREGIVQGRITFFDPYPDYARHVHTLVDLDVVAASGLRIGIDAMYGAGIGFTDRLLREAGVEPILLHHDMNPGFGGLHPEPIGKHLKPLQNLLQQDEIMLGLATDGDADHIGAMGPGGVFIDPHKIMALMLDYLVQRGQRGMVVKTVSTTQMLNRLAQEQNLPVEETPVGFNYISELMLSHDVLIGGEESGGISIQGHIPEGDGVLMGLLLAELTARQGGDINALIDQLMARTGHFSYARNDYKTKPFVKAEMVEQLTASAPATLAGVPVARLNARDGVKYLLQDDSWLLIRPSGTEPVLRVYAEAHSMEAVQNLLAAGAELAQQVQKTIS